MIVVDGRTDSEKLAELLDLAEEEALDYKSEANISKGRHRLDFVKDAVAMSNRPDGGYILLGVTDDGRPCQKIGACKDRKQFDGANLSNTVRAYVDGEFRIITQWHDIGEYEVLLVYVPGHRDGLPIPMTKIGQYDVEDSKGGKETRYVFYEGQVWLREGAGNVTLRHAHWSGLLRVHDEQVRAETEANIQAALRRMSMDAAPPIAPIPPLVLSLTLDTFADVVATHLDTGRDIRLRQFLSQAETAMLNYGDDFLSALDRLAVLILQALHFDRDAIARLGLDHLARTFAALGVGQEDSHARLAIITRVYVIGSMAVRSSLWRFAHDLVLHRATSPGYPDYYYSSWIRAGQVDASRAGLFADTHAGMMISLARDLMQDHPAFRPDVSEPAVATDGHIPGNDVLLNSLCRFDLLYALVVTAEGRDHGGAYPASIAFLQRRADPLATLIATDESVRRETFPQSDDKAIAAAVREVYEVACRESLSSRAGWRGAPDAVADFIRRNASTDT